eukprot:TRINITY_DN21851_c1_g3_i1.p1 TRINITY_DN21851_c1_g3~~TRINITY_DN21851_c1_g3_i1.p1  ORF type:complete len:318 (-),score=48.30 TRINITY_DN21851_c1_g3_i1:864-1817(-)
MAGRWNQQGTGNGGRWNQQGAGWQQQRGGNWGDNRARPYTPGQQGSRQPNAFVQLSNELTDTIGGIKALCDLTRLGAMFDDAAPKPPQPSGGQPKWVERAAHTGAQTSDLQNVLADALGGDSGKEKLKGLLRDVLSESNSGPSSASRFSGSAYPVGGDRMDELERRMKKVEGDISDTRTCMSDLQSKQDKQYDILLELRSLSPRGNTPDNAGTRAGRVKEEAVGADINQPTHNKFCAKCGIKPDRDTVDCSDVWEANGAIPFEEWIDAVATCKDITRWKSKATTLQLNADLLKECTTCRDIVFNLFKANEEEVRKEP